MFFRRTIYYLPGNVVENYWEDVWAASDFDRVAASLPNRDWWPLLEEILAALPKNALILEAGCGMGQLVYLLHSRGFRVMGVDIAAEAIKRGKQMHPELDLHACDVKSLGLPDNSVQLYLSLGVVEHEENGPDSILQEASRVVSEGGFMMLTVPYQNVYRRVREPWWRLKYWLYMRFSERLLGAPKLSFYQYAYRVAEVREFVARHGFEVDKVQYCHTAVALKKDLARALLFRMLCQRKGRVLNKKVKRLARTMDRVSARLMSHTVAVITRRTATRST